jgi:hypothetical protein
MAYAIWAVARLSRNQVASEIDSFSMIFVDVHRLSLRINYKLLLVCKIVCFNCLSAYLPFINFHLLPFGLKFDIYANNVEQGIF